MASLAMPLPVKKPLGALSGPSLGSMTNTVGGQPVQAGQVVAPNVIGSPAPPAFGYTPPVVGPAPTSTPTAAFDPNSAMIDKKALDFRLSQGTRAIQRGAAAHGTLLTGGLQGRLQQLGQELASDENQKAYSRALASYGANRDTNQQNFGQSLASFNAGTGAALDAGRLDLAGQTAGYDRTYGAQRDTFNDARDTAGTQAKVLNANQQAEAMFRQQMSDYNAQLEAQLEESVRQQNAETTRMNGLPPVGATGSMPGGFAPPRLSIPRGARVPLPRGAGY